ncbi:MAG: hypothetical protein RL033_3815 [Pseudomonadota bacterium]
MSAEPSPRHVLLILGCTVLPDGSPSGALRRRVSSALRFGQALPQVLFVPLGGAHEGRLAEATVIERMLREAGVPSAAIRAVPAGRNTLASLAAARGLLRELVAAAPQVRWHVCTDPYHVLRCRVILALWGLRSDGAPAPQPALPRRQLAALYVRDRMALIKDVPLALWLRERG